MGKYGFEYEMEYVTSYIATLSEPEVIGPVAEGLRLNIYVTGGTVDGPKMKGKILPVGADWLTIRTDGVGVLDVRQTVLTDDGALVYIYYKGITDLGPDGYKNFLEGAPPPPEGIVLRTNPWFQTVHPNYLWMTRGLFVEVGKAYLDRGEVCYDIYHVK
jgi:hypothetical protein